MKFRKVIFACVLVSLCSVIFSACFYNSTPPEPLPITVGNRVYAEVTQDTIKKFDLSVESCAGLSEIGKIDDSSEYVTGTVYVHPDPRYPNLVVALIDEKPRIFLFSNFTGCSVRMDMIRDIHGLTAADSIQEITIRRSQQFGEESTVEATITEKAEIERFLDALHDFTGTAGGIGSLANQSDNEYPHYFLDVRLSNGFSCEFHYYPKLKLFAHSLTDFFVISDSMQKWIHAQVNIND